LFSPPEGITDLSPISSPRSKTLTLTALEGVPPIQAGDDLTSLVLEMLDSMGLALIDGDILVLTQKVVSKAEGRQVRLDEVHPSTRARELAAETGKDARLVELILQESNTVLRVRPGLIIVEHRLGFICANAGIDRSNVSDPQGDSVLLLPEDPDASAEEIRSSIRSIRGIQIGVMMIDSHGRAWRLGTVGTTVGLAGLPGLVDLRGREDLFGYQLETTVVGAADELAGAASLLMGQAAEGTPIVHVRGFPYELRESSLAELIRPLELDLFR
jgi:coenzyme F420-0:L-glutamate ligase / coenzyme F420-1:gamma-L-glutamate ligase